MGGGIVGLRGFVMASNLRISRCGCQFTGGKFFLESSSSKFLKEETKKAHLFPSNSEKNISLSKAASTSAPFGPSTPLRGAWARSRT